MIPHGVFPSHFIFLWLHSGVWKFLGQALKLSCSCDLLAHCARLGIESVPPQHHELPQSDS